MKTLLFSLMVLASFSTFAFTDNMFTGVGTGHSSLYGTTGCAEAKREAINDAKTKCLDAGFRKCKKISVVKQYSISADNIVYGRCGYKAYFEGN